MVEASAAHAMGSRSLVHTHFPFTFPVKELPQPLPSTVNGSPLIAPLIAITNGVSDRKLNTSPSSSWLH